MPCPVCGTELDTEDERPRGMWGPFPTSEIVCMQCGETTGVIWGEWESTQHA